VKFIKWREDNLVFGLTKREHSQLFSILGLYPQVPPAHHRLSKTGTLPKAADAEKLLEDALREQRQANRKLLTEFLQAPTRFNDSDKGLQFELSTSEADWLLQILNDIRIGSWVLIGSPENIFKALNSHTAPQIAAMEIAGFFQAHLLDAISSGPTAET